MSIELGTLESLESVNRELKERMIASANKHKVRPFGHNEMLILEEKILGEYFSDAIIADDIQLLALYAYSSDTDEAIDAVYERASKIAKKVLARSDIFIDRRSDITTFEGVVSWCSLDIIDCVMKFQELGIFAKPSFVPNAINEYNRKISFERSQQNQRTTYNQARTINNSVPDNNNVSEPEITPTANNPKTTEISTGKRVLSWLVLLGCYILFVAVVVLDLLLFSYLSKLYFQLSPFLKIIVILIGGSTIIGLFVAPLFYGIPMTYAASEAVCPSRKGDRYIALGALIIVSCVINIIIHFRIQYVLIGIYGIALFVYGRSHTVDGE